RTRRGTGPCAQPAPAHVAVADRSGQPGSRGPLPHGVRHRQTQRRRGGPVALPGPAFLPLAARRPPGPESSRLKSLLTVLLACLLASGAGASGVEASKPGTHPLLDLARELERTRDKKPRGM